MKRIGIEQLNTPKLLDFYKQLFAGTNTSYGMFFYPHTFSPIQYKEPWLPMPFIKIIDTIPMKKSNGKIQTAQCYKIYPRMEVTRFDHMVFAESLGVDLLSILEENGYEIDNKTKIAFLVFLLVHDIGHGPYSHPFEKMVDGYKGMHEDIGRRAIRELPEVRNALESIFPGLTEMVIDFKKYDKYGLSLLLEGIFDLDRAAFLIMDTYLMDGKEKDDAYLDIVNCVYDIFKNIVIKDGKLYIKMDAFGSVDTFLKIRAENYLGVYQKSERVLSDLVLKRLGNKILDFSKTPKYEEKLNELPVSISKEISDFVDFISEMKTKKADIDLNKYYSLEDRDFNRIFYFILLFDEPDLNRDALLMLSSDEFNNKYYRIEKSMPETGDEDFYVNNKVKIYKSTPEENITFINNDGTLVDYKDCPNRFTPEFEWQETISFTRVDHITLDNERAIRENLIAELNNLLLENKYEIMMLEPRNGYEADNEVIYQINLYVKSIEAGLSIDEHCKMFDISKHILLAYLLMYSNHRRIFEICIMLLSDNLGAYLDDFDFGALSHEDRGQKLELKG